MKIVLGIEIFIVSLSRQRKLEKPFIALSAGIKQIFAYRETKLSLISKQLFVYFRL
jgi:hypothetical protein